MIIGIDVGGTHTDGVLLKPECKDLNRGYTITAASKVETIQENLMQSITSVLDKLISKTDKARIKRIVLSTTLAENILQEEKHDPVGLVLIPGPGLNSSHLEIGEENVILSGYIDHRGQEVRPLNKNEVLEGLGKLTSSGIENLAAAGKFSTRNPHQEELVKEMAAGEDCNFKTVSLGHELSGSLNFPRRAASAYYNTAVTSVHRKFITAVKQVLEERKIEAEVFILKCDGGTMLLDVSGEMPIKTVNSGPAASVMGAQVLSDLEKNEITAFVLDVGGTTTDIGLFLDGEPVFMPEGIIIKGLPTLIRGLYTVSIPIGGDSEIYIKKNTLCVGPERHGPAAACGGRAPTPTDALLVLGYIQPDENFNLEAAEKALSTVLTELKEVNEEAESLDLKEFCRIIISKVKTKIIETILEMIKDLENQPVYTISRLLEDFEINPELILVMGGPAWPFKEILADNKIPVDLFYDEESLNCKVEVLDQAGVANAVGAAFARPTVETTVRVDTEKGYLDIVEVGIHRLLKRGERLNIEDVEKMAVEWTRKRCGIEKAPVEITGSESFNVIHGFSTAGKIMEVKAQVKPGRISEGGRYNE